MLIAITPSRSNLSSVGAENLAANGDVEIEVDGADAVSVRMELLGAVPAGVLRAGVTHLLVYRTIGPNSFFWLLNPSFLDPTTGEVSAQFVGDINAGELVGELSLSNLPDELTGKDADQVDGFHFSTDSTGSDADTIYFR